MLILKLFSLVVRPKLDQKIIYTVFRLEGRNVIQTEGHSWKFRHYHYQKDCRSEGPMETSDSYDEGASHMDA